jgi:hypothetical protein
MGMETVEWRSDGGSAEAADGHLLLHARPAPCVRVLDPSERQDEQSLRTGLSPHLENVFFFTFLLLVPVVHRSSLSYVSPSFKVRFNIRSLSSRLL